MNRFTTTMMISALGLVAQLARAAPPQDPPTAIVHFADLDLAHGRGITVLFRRLKAAAEMVCTSQNGRDLGSQTRYKMCWQNALGKAVTEVGQPALTAYYRAKFAPGNARIQLAQK